jgi:hypothetical protein
MLCNIDSKGRKYRAISGLCCLSAGIALLASAFLWPALFWQLLIMSAFVALCGVFQIFESWKGWCAFRAMGLKTRW